MAKKKKQVSERDAEWTEARRLCRLSADDVRKAKELGFNPRTLIKNRPNAHQLWKQPVHLWVRELYERQQKKKAKRHGAPATKRVEPAMPAAEISGSSQAEEIPF